MKYRVFYIFALIVCQVYYGFTQSPADIGPSSYEVGLIPASPEVEDLGKFGTIPVNKYNGTANINIPIYEIDHEGLKIPLSLNYNTSGIRVNQDASWVGLGWNLSEGMVITREINGYDDINSSEFDGENIGWLYTEDYYKPEPPYTDIYKLTSEELQFLHNKNASNNPHDLEPDVFSVTLPGGSFKFYLPKITGSEQFLSGTVVNEKNFKVIYDLSNKAFEVTDQGGYRYLFTQKEFSTGYSSWDADPENISEIEALKGIPYWHTNQTRKMIKAWKVSQIISPLGRKLNFSYQEGFFLSFPHFSEKIKFPIQHYTAQTKFESILNYSPYVSASFTAFHVLYLTNISGDFGSVTLNLSDRKDLFSKEAKARFAEEPTWNPSIEPNEYNAQKIENIVVKDFNNNVVKEAKFFYNYFNEAMANDPFKERYIRLKLDSVSVQDRTYRFAYDHPNNLPPKDTKAIDFWGFYNGVNNSIRIPSFNRFFLAHNSNGRNYEQFYKMIAANRKSDINYGKYGILKKVTYPTGGYSIFDYEGNSVTLKGISYSPTYYDDGLFRRSEINSSQAYNFRYQYLKLANDPDYSLYDWSTCQVGSQSVSPNGEEFEITEVSLCTGQSYNIRIETTVSCNVGCGQGINPSGRAVWIENTQTGETQNIVNYSSFSNNGSKSYETELMLPPGKYKLRSTSWSVNSPFLVVATANASAFVWTNTTMEENAYEEFEVGGARIRKITDYDTNGNFLEAKGYSYGHELENGMISSYGKLMDDLVFTSRGGNLFEYAPEYFNVDGGQVGIVNSDNMIRSNPSASGSHIGYSQVTQMDMDNSGISKGQIVSKYYNNPNEYLTRHVGSTPVFTSSTDGAYGNLDNWESVLSYYLVSYGDVYILGSLPITYEHLNGRLLQELIYNTNEEPLKDIVNTYQEYNERNSVYTQYPVMFWTGKYFPLANPYENISYDRLRINKLMRLSSTVTRKYFNNKEVVDSINYFYENSGHYQITKTSRENSEGEEIIHKTYYPQDLPSQPFMDALITQNRVNSIIKTESLKRDSTTSAEKVLSVQQTNYSDTTNPNGLLLPYEVKTLKGGGENPEQRIVYEKYDQKGNLIQYRKTDGIPVSLLWGYNGQYPVAKIENATYTEVVATGVNLSVLQSKSSTEAAKITELNKIRNHPGMTNTLVTTYTYKPLIGISTATDPKGEKTTYTYDNFNRLKFIKDDTGKLLEEYKYHYKN